MSSNKKGISSSNEDTGWAPSQRSPQEFTNTKPNTEKNSRDTTSFPTQEQEGHKEQEERVRSVIATGQTQTQKTATESGLLLLEESNRADDSEDFHVLMKETLQTYKEDFFAEHSERRLLVAEVDSLRQQVAVLQYELSAAKQQVEIHSKDLKRTKQETENIRQILRKHKDERKLMLAEGKKGDESHVTTGDETDYMALSSAGSASVFSDRTFWSCAACTYKNPSQRSECCEMCGTLKSRPRQQDEGELESDRVKTIRKSKTKNPANVLFASSAWRETYQIRVDHHQSRNQGDTKSLLNQYHRGDVWVV